MKTITEFSGILLQRAAAAQRAFRAANPRPAEAAPPAVDAAAPPTPESEPATAELATIDGATGEVGGEESSALGDSQPEAATSEAPPAANLAVEVAASGEEDAVEAASEEPVAEVAPAALDLGTGPEAEAVGALLQVQGDRLARLMEALDVVGNRAAQVRLVRVLQGEDAPSGSQKRGEFYYAVDLMPRPQNQQRDGFDSRGGDSRRGQGGRDRGGRPGAGGSSGGPRGGGGGAGGGSGGYGAQAGRGGKFSNDRPSGRDGDSREPRGEMPRGGAGWMLTRAPEDRRGAGGAPGADRRGDRRPPTGPRFDNRGPRPPQGARPGPGQGAGPGARPGAGPGDRFPRGPRPEGAGARSGPRPQGAGDRPPGGPRFEGAGTRPSGGPSAPGNGGRGPRRPEGANDRGRNDRNWTGPRRGGWDEPLVVEPTDAAVSAAPNPAPINSPSLAPESPDSARADANVVPPSDNNG